MSEATIASPDKGLTGNYDCVTADEIIDSRKRGSGREREGVDHSTSKAGIGKPLLEFLLGCQASMLLHYGSGGSESRALRSASARASEPLRHMIRRRQSSCAVGRSDSVFLVYARWVFFPLCLFLFFMIERERAFSFRFFSCLSLRSGVGLPGGFVSFPKVEWRI